jgi:hypothetical protein
LQYYWLLRSIFKVHPSLRRWRTRCCHCRICFLTHPRNAGRQDLGCPFGCREVHRKAASNKRSTAYYQTAEGKIKRRALNQRRSRVARLGPPGPPPQEPTAWPGEIVRHVCAVVSEIEGRPFTFPEILALLTRIVRQHRIARRRRRDQVVAWLNEFPP